MHYEELTDYFLGLSILRCIKDYPNINKVSDILQKIIEEKYYEKVVDENSKIITNVLLKEKFNEKN